MNISQASSNHQIRAENSRYREPWVVPKSFSVTSEEEPIFLVNKEIGRHKQVSQPFSSTPRNVEETLALSAWEDSMEDSKSDTREENFMDKNSIKSYSSVKNNTVNNYDDDTASVITCSTTTTTTTSTSDLPSVVHVTIADLIKIQERRKSMQDNINNYNMTTDTTSVINKEKQRLVNFEDEIIESPGRPLKNSVDLSSQSIISNDSSTVKDNNSSHQEEISEFSITPSLGLSRVTRQEFENAKIDKQKALRAWVKFLWPQPRLPDRRQLTYGLTSSSLSKRNLNPLTIGIIVPKSQMIQTAIIKGTKHKKNEIGKNGQIKFSGEPDLIKGIYDPREYILLHCPTYHNPPYHNGDPRIPWTEHFLLNKVLPRLAEEATRIQNEVGLYLTVKETLLRGLEHYPLYGCRYCPEHHTRYFNYVKIREHLKYKHSKNQINDEEMIKIILREYISAFYKNNLPPKI
ncbi:hypothetical protein C1645_733254 [Glomus cerebriforme]|uniref:Uncharacterized protein n=1 Tax=Glomus cerebriforme TaxID=658196 RepID=A0A397TEE3_9GLOM|nr:hypothetical protein C1645_733254 [Glomus cerebriforme]